MKKIICLAAALTLALTACGGPPAQESNDPAPTVTALTTAAPTPTASTAVPTAAVSVMPATPAPTVAEVTAPPTPEAAPTPTPVPVSTPAADTPAPSPAPAVEPTPEPVAVSSVAPTASPVPVRPSDEEVLAAYHQAREAYGWFDLTTLPLDYTQTKMVGETPYYPVADERFPTMDALRAYLKTLFSDEIVDALLPMDGEHYRDIDGVLCAMDADRGTDENSGTVIETVNWPAEGGDALCTVQVSVELLWEDPAYPEGARKYEFPYQKVGEKWVFTHFEAIM